MLCLANHRKGVHFYLALDPCALGERTLPHGRGSERQTQFNMRPRRR